MDAIFRVDGNRVATSPHAAGPGIPACSTAPRRPRWWCGRPSGSPTPVPMHIARVTIDLMRPVPVAPLTLETEVLREGRKIQLCAVRLLAGGVLTVAATVLKIKSQSQQLPPEATAPALELPGPDQSRIEDAAFSSSPFLTGMSLRAARGRFGVPGPGAIWYRADRPLVEGSAISQAMRAVVASDFCNGTSAVLDFRQWTFSTPISPSAWRASRSANGFARRRVLDRPRRCGPCDGKARRRQRLFRPRDPEPCGREALRRLRPGGGAQENACAPCDHSISIG